MDTPVGSAVDTMVRVILMTAPDRETADRLASTLVEERLAACGNLLPGVDSVYRWQGVVERAREVLVILKTTGETVGPLLRRAAELHPYDVPELLVLPVLEGHAPYLDWVRSECAAAPPDGEAGAGGTGAGGGASA